MAFFDRSKKQAPQPQTPKTPAPMAAPPPPRRQEQQIQPLTPQEQQWIQDNIAKARELVAGVTPKGKTPRLDLASLDEAWAAWANNPTTGEDPGQVVTAFGVAFGQYFVNQLSMNWVVVTDAYGTDIAVHAPAAKSGAPNAPAHILISPMLLVAKAYEARQGRFMATLFPQLKQNIEQMRGGPVAVLA